MEAPTNKRIAGVPPAGGPEARDPRPAGAASALRHSHKYWHSRGYLPHCDTPELIQSVTFRLHDSLPESAIARLAAEASPLNKRQRIESLIDAGYGECFLQKANIANIVENALLHFDGTRYRLLAWCVMPNHVHVLIETCTGYPLGNAVHSWKSYTAKRINQILRLEGAVWHPDYFDRYIRDQEHLLAAIAYIEQNPVNARLVEKTEDWQYSSGSRASRPQVGQRPVIPGKI